MIWHSSFWFCLRNSFFMSPHKFSIGLRSGDCAGRSVTLILLVWEQKCCLLPGVFWGCCLVETSISRAFPLQHKATWPLNIETLQRPLADRVASHRCLLTVPVITGNFSPSLIIGWVFATLDILWCIQMVVFHFLAGLFGYFKAKGIILAEQPIIFFFFKHFPFSNQRFNQWTLFFWTMTNFSGVFRGYIVHTCTTCWLHL